MTLSLTKETGNVGEFTYAGREGYAINNCQLPRTTKKCEGKPGNISSETLIFFSK